MLIKLVTSSFISIVEIIIKGHKDGIITLNQSKSPFSAPLLEISGNNTKSSTNKTDATIKNFLLISTLLTLKYSFTLCYDKLIDIIPCPVPVNYQNFFFLK